MWMVLAVGSAFFAGITAVLAKCGVKKTDSDVATAVRTTVVLVMAWLMVAVKGSASQIGQIHGMSLLFLVLSGLATGASWICYFKALSLGDVNKVTPIDKSSTILTVLFAMVFLHETNHWGMKLLATALMGVGTYWMIEKKEGKVTEVHDRWLIYGLLSAVFAALTSILAKVGMAQVESNLGTAIRTCVVLMMAWAIVLGKKKAPLVRRLDGREGLFLVLSGLATGASWLCYYAAIQQGVVSVVVPIDKLSIVVSICFSSWVLKEKLPVKGWLGLGLMVVGTILMAMFP